MKFEVGDHVKIGGRTSPRDGNYGKRGIVVGRTHDNDLIVQMKDRFTSGASKIDWLDDSFWEYDVGLSVRPLI